MSLLVTSSGPVWTPIWRIAGYDVRCSGHPQASCMPKAFFARHKISLSYEDIKLRDYVTNLNPVVNNTQQPTGNAIHQQP